MEGSRRTLVQGVAAINEGYLGLTAFMDMDALNADAARRTQ